MPESKIVWLAGEYKEEQQWEIIGIFETEYQANEACKTLNQFIGPIELNKPEYNQVKWEGSYYPQTRVRWRMSALKVGK
jgi:hypothetical protein